MVITPVVPSMANWPPSFPAVIWKLSPDMASPVVATVTRVVPDAVPSARLPVCPAVMSIATSLMVITTSSVTALEPSVMVKVTVWLVADS